MIRFFSFALVGIGIAASVATAHAGSVPILDPTGVWTGTLKCKGIFNGEKTTINGEAETLEITATGETVTAELNSEVFHGRVFTDPDNPTKADLFLVGCSTDPADPQAQVVRAAITTKKNGTMKLKAVGISGDVNQVFTCKFKFERIDETDPSVGACPSGGPV